MLILTLCVVLDIDYPHTLWTRLWEIHGGSCDATLLEYLVVDCLVPLAYAYCIPYDDDSLEELDYVIGLACLDGQKACCFVPTPHI